MPHPTSKLPQLFLALRCLAEFIHQMHHRIAWQRIVPFLGLALSAHLIHGARQILKNIKGLRLQRQLAFAERTGQRSVPYQITGVKRLLAVTTPAIFLQVGRERNLQEFCLHLRIEREASILCNVHYDLSCLNCSSVNPVICII